LGSSRQTSFWKAALTVLLSVEKTEVLADDLVCAVAFDALRAGVPGKNVTFVVQLKDRIAKVTRDLTERLEARERLNASETRFRRLVDSVVDYISDEITTVVIDSIQDGHRPEPSAILSDTPALLLPTTTLSSHP
jgi:PAS domain-containing protein